MSQNRSFGSEIGNTDVEMTASNGKDAADVPLAKHTQPLEIAGQMEKSENIEVTSRLPKPLAVEVYSKIHNSTLSKDDLLDEIEDLVDEIFYPGEKLMNGGKEFVVVSSEKRGGLTTYTMHDGTKIGHRDLRRKKGLSVEEIKQIAIEDADYSEEEKQWKVKASQMVGIEIREKAKKFAPIFNRRASTASSATTPVTVVKLDSDDEDGGEEDQKLSTPSAVRTPIQKTRNSGGPATSASRRIMEKKLEKERKEKEKMEKKEKEKEEKLRKKEEEKAKKMAEKEEKKTKRNGTMDAFVKKSVDSNGASSDSPATSVFSPTSKWGERRVALGVKKMEDSWTKRDLESFNEACGWCEKNLSEKQRQTIQNPIFKYAIQKSIDKTKDRATMKGMKWPKKAEYKLEMAAKRKDQYVMYEPKIKAWFNEKETANDDLLLTSEKLRFDDEVRKLECGEEMLNCIEITQYFVSMRKILLWNENITAEQLQKDLHGGLEGFANSTYKMLANLLETALQEKEHEKTAHCNARLSEFPITVHTITELIRAFFIGADQLSLKRDWKRNAEGKEEEEEEEEEEENEEEKEKEEEKREEEDPEEDAEEDFEKDEADAQKKRILALFVDSAHLYDWPAHKQMEVLYAMKEVVHGLPIIREWFLRDANSDKLAALKVAAGKIAKKIEQFNQQLSDLPTGEITENMSRTESREAEKIQKKRNGLEKQLDDLKDELEENRQAAARERDDLERIFRVITIGTDRHLRKYYWFAYSLDAGIWVQDFGTTSYEKWVGECREKGIMDVESLSVENRPDYLDLPICTSDASETWFHLNTESSIRNLTNALKKNGRREKQLKKYLANNLDDILASINKKSQKSQNSGEEDVEEEVQDEQTDEKEAPQNEEEIVEKPSSKFAGPFGALKSVMTELLTDWKASGISKIGDSTIFEKRMEEANSLEEMKRLVIELATSVPKEVLIEKFPMDVALAKKCFSHLKMNRFCYRIQEATNSSCLHMLLAYFDARIDSRRTLQELPCQVCRKKTGVDRKLMCKQCTVVYHYTCHRPTISRELFEEDGFKEGWWCAKCTKDHRRQQLIDAQKSRKLNEEAASDNEEDEMEDEEMDEIDDIEEQEMTRGRSAKRKANAAMRDVLEFEGVLRHPQAPPPPKKMKKEVKPEVQELFASIEKANPRLYKLIVLIPAQSRSTRNSQQETRSLPEIEDDLDVYTSADHLRSDLSAFFKQARGYIETHNSRKMDEFDSLISELNFV